MPVTANSIITPQTPKTGTVVATTANATYSDAPTNSVKLITAGPNGARVTRLWAVPRETVTDCQLQIFRSPDAGVTKRFFNNAKMAAHTMAQTTAAPVTDLGYSDDNPLILAANEEVWVAVGITKAVVFTAEWADY